MKKLKIWRIEMKKMLIRGFLSRKRVLKRVTVQRHFPVARSSLPLLRL